ncbi:MAG: hypothetical protein KDC85_06695 [Saprospiraceae bacterium]|nr:hypothetical protein [Saprospiraceae bacterium]MCB9324835.1 hypothetical protein [Lewinellaceae bacterium]
MKLFYVETGDKFEAEIERLKTEQVKKLKGNKNFVFDWSLESNYDVYRIKRIDKEETLGLISLADIPSELRIHIRLIESSKENKGQSKIIEGIPGSLIGFACKTAFEKGYDGFVSLFPKTNLIDYYHKKFGFSHMGTHMVVFLETAQSIIEKYLTHE